MSNFIKLEKINLKTTVELNEKWIQQRLIEDPSLLGLGDVFIKDTERIQPTGGRLDILLHDPETNRRYEVELQLGKTDETHIIRTIEYWDTEKKRYPQYEHVAVIIAEDITGRFLNVISLFNGHIPIIAIQLSALRVGQDVSLVFTKVLDVVNLGTDEEDEQQPSDRKYWESIASKETVALTDELLAMAVTFAPGYQLKYNKYYIGLNKDGISQNFISLKPRKNTIILHFKMVKDEEVDALLSGTDMDVLSYDAVWNEYRIRLKKADIKANQELLLKMMKKAFAAYFA